MQIMAPGAKQVLWSPVMASTGVLTLSGVTFDFQDFERNTIAANVAVTGIDPPGATVRAWYAFDCDAPPGGGVPLVRGQMFWIKWREPVSGTSDGINRRERPSEMLIINE